MRRKKITICKVSMLLESNPANDGQYDTSMKEATFFFQPT